MILVSWLGYLKCIVKWFIFFHMISNFMWIYILENLLHIIYILFGMRCVTHTVKYMYEDMQSNLTSSKMCKSYGSLNNNLFSEVSYRLSMCTWRELATGIPKKCRFIILIVFTEAFEEFSLDNNTHKHFKAVITFTQAGYISYCFISL